MIRPPNIALNYEALPTNPEERQSFLLDVFGQYLVWMRRFVLDGANRRVASEAAREIGSILKAVYDDVARMDPGQQDICLRLAQRCVDDFAYQLLGLLANAGNDLALGASHAIRLRLDMEIYEIESETSVDSITLNRGGARHLSQLWGRWINRKGQSADDGHA